MKIVKIYFDVVPPFGPCWSVKYLNFGQKLPIWTTDHAFLERRYPVVTKNPYHVLSLEWSQKKGISSWTSRTLLILVDLLVVISHLVKKHEKRWQLYFSMFRVNYRKGLKPKPYCITYLHLSIYLTIANTLVM